MIEVSREDFHALVRTDLANILNEIRAEFVCGIPMVPRWTVLEVVEELCERLGLSPEDAACVWDGIKDQFKGPPYE